MQVFGKLFVIHDAAEVDDLLRPGRFHVGIEITGCPGLPFVEVPGGGTHGMDQVIGGIQVFRHKGRVRLLQKIDLHHFDLFKDVRIDGKTFSVAYGTNDLMARPEELGQ